VTIAEVPEHQLRRRPEATLLDRPVCRPVAHGSTAGGGGAADPAKRHMGYRVAMITDATPHPARGRR
jgi:hypothetical protein